MALSHGIGDESVHNSYLWDLPGCWMEMNWEWLIELQKTISPLSVKIPLTIDQAMETVCIKILRLVFVFLDGHGGPGAIFGMFVHLIVLCSHLNPSLQFSTLILLLLPGKLSLPEHKQVLALPVGCLWSFRRAVCLQPLIHSVSQQRRCPHWQNPACTLFFVFNSCLFFLSFSLPLFLTFNLPSFFSLFLLLLCPGRLVFSICVRGILTPSIN